MNQDRRTRFVATIGILAVVVGLGYFAFRSVAGFQVSGFLSRFREDRSIERSESGPVESVPYDLSAFDSIEVDGAWDLVISQGEQSVEIQSSRSARDALVVRVDGDTLRLDLRGGFRSIGSDLEATIVMPDLEQLEIDGAADITFRGFDLDELLLEVDGAASIEGLDSRVDRLELDVDGAARVDLRDVSVVDADVNLDGAGKLDITMAGGELEGEVNGVGTVTWGGELTLESIDIDGIGSVQRR